MEDIAAFVSNPFLPIDIEQVAAKFQKVFSLPSEVDMEMVDLKNDTKMTKVTFGDLSAERSFLFSPHVHKK